MFPGDTCIPWNAAPMFEIFARYFPKLFSKYIFMYIHCTVCRLNNSKNEEKKYFQLETKFNFNKRFQLSRAFPRSKSMLRYCRNLTRSNGHLT